jgi:anaphase-promoting complex subunit 1
MWPAFHNGVAAGLRIVRDMPTTDSTWIVYNKPDSGGDPLDRHSHAGLLMALGLSGHLVCACSLDWHG